MAEGEIESELRAINLRIGATIREQRRRLHMPQHALAIQVGASDIQMQRYEAGENQISAGRLLLVARALSVPVTALYPCERTDPVPGIAGKD